MKKTIVITGGSEGLGKEIAKCLSNENTVIILSNNKDKLIIAANELKCNYYLCDITKYEMIENVVKDIVKKFGSIDVLINNAGVWLAGDITENTKELINNCIDVNIKGPIYMTKAVLPYMYKNNNGMIINVCSQSSFDTDDFASVYTTSKWAMRGFTRSIQKDLGKSKTNIKVTGFYPGFIQTNIFKNAGNDYDTSTGLETEKVAKAIKFIIECDDDVLIPELGIKDIEDF